MALVKCPECGNQVSTAAASCPKCGAPVGSPGISTPLATIQQTSKRLKLHSLFSSITLCIGLVWLIAGIAGGEAGASPSPVAIILLLVGIVWYIATRFRIWWHHE
jgi:uncharacterized membrane protein YvbJ